MDSRQDAGADPVAQTKALTISGTLQRNLDEKKIAAARARLFEKHAGLKIIFNDPDTEIMIVKIRSVQLLDGITNAYFEEVIRKRF